MHINEKEICYAKIINPNYNRKLATDLSETKNLKIHYFYIIHSVQTHLNASELASKFFLKIKFVLRFVSHFNLE